MSQRVVQYQAVMQMAQSAPDIYNMPQLHRNMLEVLGIKNADKLVPLPDDQKPRDPVTENMSVLKGEPVKAFLNQDHQSHIAVHMAMMQDPSVMAVIGQNPRAPVIQAALMAHLAEHAGFQYRKQIEAQLGLTLPPEDEDLPPQIEQALSGMLAQAAQQAFQLNQQQAQQQMQDPIIQMQMQELQIKQQEVQRKIQKDQMDATLRQEQLDIDRERVEIQGELEGTKLGAKIAKEKDEMDRKEQIEGTKMGIEMAHKKDQANVQKAQVLAQMMKGKQ
jgi:hypothetical protein